MEGQTPLEIVALRKYAGYNSTVAACYIILLSHGANFQLDERRALLIQAIRQDNFVVAQALVNYSANQEDYHEDLLFALEEAEERQRHSINAINRLPWGESKSIFYLRAGLAHP